MKMIRTINFIPFKNTGPNLISKLRLIEELNKSSTEDKNTKEDTQNGR